MGSKLSRQRLISDLRAFAEEEGGTPTKTAMNERGPHSSTPYYTEFGSWNDALEAAGLGTNHRNGIPEEELIAELRRLDDRLERTPRFEDMQEHGEFSASVYMRRFGSWPAAKEAAGLNPETTTSRRVSRAALIDAVRELADELGKAPTQKEMNEFGRYSHRPYYRVWDSWKEALRAAGLDPNHDLGIPKPDLIRALQTLADELDRTPTFDQMNQLGEYSLWPYLRTWGSWNEAVEAAGLEVNREYGVANGPLQYGPRWSEQREKALARDEHLCQECGMSNGEHEQEYGEGLHVHHRKKFRTFESREEANQIENLVTLCRECHWEWERELEG